MRFCRYLVIQPLHESSEAQLGEVTSSRSHRKTERVTSSVDLVLRHSTASERRGAGGELQRFRVYYAPGWASFFCTLSLNPNNTILQMKKLRMGQEEHLVQGPPEPKLPGQV